MRANTVSGYQGPVTVLTPGGEEIAQAACRYRAEADDRGEDRWQGRLHRIVPSGAVGTGAYQLQFPNGEQGAVTIESIEPNTETVFFVGAGPRPLNPL